MSNKFIGEVRTFTGTVIPSGWLACRGQILNTADYSALGTFLGSRFGGDGSTTFGLPDLTGRAVLGSYIPGYLNDNYYGSSIVTFTEDNLPSHAHGASFTGTDGTLSFSVTATEKYVTSGLSPSGMLLAKSAVSFTSAAYGYAPTATEGAFLGGVVATGGSFTGGTVTVNATGDGQSVDIMPPFSVLNICIAYQGVTQ
ncbi:MAG: tail fiber protein [Opitutaceae bacterium]|jgi:microcystin-dependent protein